MARVLSTVSLLVLSLLLLTVSCTSGQVPLKDSAMILKNPQDGKCGSVAISERLILTAGHCVKWGVFRSVSIFTGSGGATRAHVIAADRAADLALLELDADAEPLIPVKIREGVEGEHVRSFSPLFQRETKGTLQRRVFLSGGDILPLYWETNLTIRNGFSGSPVIAESDGMVVGVISACQVVPETANNDPGERCKPNFAVVAGVRAPSEEELRALEGATNGAST